MDDEEFHEKISGIFEDNLINKRLFIRDKYKDKVFGEYDMNYEKVFFDNSMNIYKVLDGSLVKVNNKDFDVIVK